MHADEKGNKYSEGISRLQSAKELLRKDVEAVSIRNLSRHEEQFKIIKWIAQMGGSGGRVLEWRTRSRAREVGGGEDGPLGPQVCKDWDQRDTLHMPKPFAGFRESVFYCGPC